MLPSVSNLPLNRLHCVPCGTPVRPQELQEQQTHRQQIEEAECDICGEPLGSDPRRGEGAPATPSSSEPHVPYEDFCGHHHYFHKWCVHQLHIRNGRAQCPDCRRDMTTDVLTRATADLIAAYPSDGIDASKMLDSLQGAIDRWSSAYLNFSAAPLQQLLTQCCRLLGQEGDDSAAWKGLKRLAVYVLYRASADDIHGSIDAMRSAFGLLSRYREQHGRVGARDVLNATVVQDRIVDHDARAAAEAVTRLGLRDDEDVERLTNVLSECAERWDQYFRDTFLRTLAARDGTALHHTREALILMIRGVASILWWEGTRNDAGDMPIGWLTLQVQVVEFLYRITGDASAEIAVPVIDLILNEDLMARLETHALRCEGRLSKEVGGLAAQVARRLRARIGNRIGNRIAHRRGGRHRRDNSTGR